MLGDGETTSYNTAVRRAFCEFRLEARRWHIQRGLLDLSASQLVRLLSVNLFKALQLLVQCILNHTNTETNDASTEFFFQNKS